MVVVTRRSSKRTPQSESSDPLSMPPTPTPLSKSNTMPVSPSRFKSIFLQEWWLVKQRKGLAVGGVTSIERERLFFSAAIAKRHEANVLETEDGIIVIFRGFINPSRTCQNGFPSQACHHFLFGFPHDWKKYTAHSFGDEYTDGVTGFADSNASSRRRADDDLPFSLHDNDLTKRQDFLLSNSGVLNYCPAPKKICNGRRNSLGNVSMYSESTDSMECNLTMKNMECECKDNTTSLKSSQPQGDMVDNGENGVSDVPVESQAGNSKSGQTLMGMNDPCTGLSGKSTVKSSISMKQMRKDQLSSDCKEKQCIRQEMSEDAGNTCGSRMVTRSISKRSHKTLLGKDEKVTPTCVSSPVRRSHKTLLGKDEKVTVTCVSSPVRRSPRLYNCRK